MPVREPADGSRLSRDGAITHTLFGRSPKNAQFYDADDATATRRNTIDDAQTRKRLQDLIPFEDDSAALVRQRPRTTAVGAQLVAPRGERRTRPLNLDAAEPMLDQGVALERHRALLAHVHRARSSVRHIVGREGRRRTAAHAHARHGVVMHVAVREADARAPESECTATLAMVQPTATQHHL
jgi:hypothetical protein